MAAAEEILVRNGGCPDGSTRRLLRFILHRSFGGRSLHKLPPLLGDLLVAAGVLHKAPLCLWQAETWRRQNNYTFI